MDKARRAVKGDKTEAARVEVLQKVHAALDQGIPARAIKLDEAERALLNDSHLLTNKPVLFIGNVHEDDLAGTSSHVTILREIAVEQNSDYVLVCGLIEAELSELEESE